MGIEAYVLTQEQMKQLECLSEQTIENSDYQLRFRNYYGNIFLATIVEDDKETVFSLLTTYSPKNREEIYTKAKAYVEDRSLNKY